MTPGDLCDLILVFFDPMGQALCKRTLNIVESLNEKHGDRLRFYLSKADEAGGESDRQVLSCSQNSFVEKSQSGSTFKVTFKSVPQRVMMQIVQELCKRPGLNKCGFDMPTIYIPNPNKVRDLLLQLFLTEQACPCVPSVLCFCLSTAKPLCEPDRRGVSHSWEDY